ncbi:hypothetical protein IW261DRAFT_1421123 [Armillaria novae-zelandiae]|uniref:Uncharacterized protein n=1 Tax=Armillaria novae-zelandiae TaxID=153914 RepID=A0AA39P4G8_9AGAR|nr:hypothetical protein IW261DRAFT_1421123 [Armillaria novae-zelandiae]
MSPLQSSINLSTTSVILFICDDAYVEPIRQTLNGLQLKLYRFGGRARTRPFLSYFCITNVIEEGKALNIITSRRGALQSVITGMQCGGELDRSLNRIWCNTQAWILLLDWQSAEYPAKRCRMIPTAPSDCDSVKKTSIAEVLSEQVYFNIDFKFTSLRSRLNGKQSRTSLLVKNIVD